MDTSASADEQARKAASMAKLLVKAPNPSEQRGSIAEPKSGVLPLNISRSRRDGLLYIPKSYSTEKAAPVVVILHGAGGHAEGALQLISDYADDHGLILIAPESRGRTWDMILGGYGPDVEFINQCLTKVFNEYTVDPKHLCIAGFSDGASYSISLGVCNGFLFSHIIGFSPGFIRVQRYEDSPLIYVSHGKRDSVLHIDNCSRRLVPKLLEHKYRVTYKEFEGGHTVPPSIAAEALTWFMQTTDKQ